MKHEPESEAGRWLLQAKHDLDDANFSSEANKKVPWGHSVAELCETASLKDSDFKNIKKRAATLDIYYIPTHYPNGLPSGIPSEAYLKEDAERALSICNEVIDLVEKKIGKIKYVIKNIKRGT